MSKRRVRHKTRDIIDHGKLHGLGDDDHPQYGAGGSTDHGSLTGLGDDDHSQYVHISTARTITAQHSFSPGVAQAPFLLGANAQGQLVTGLRADQLNKQVIAGSGLTTGGTLTSDVTLNVGAGDGIDVAADTVAVDVTDLIGGGLVEQATNNIALADTVAGAGLTIASKVLAVGAGDGIDVAADSISVDVTDIIDTNYSLTESSNNIRINLAANPGLEHVLAGAGLRVQLPGSSGLDISASGLFLNLKTTSGLGIDGTGVSVGAGDGIDVLTSTVAVDVTDIIGLGLTESSNNIDVGAGDGINVLSSTIEVDVTDLIGAGLVEIATNNIGLADSVAGTGLAIDGSKVLSVNTGTGLTTSGDNVIHGTGDFGDLHTNYTEHDVSETISVLWTFNAGLDINGTLEFQGPESITTTSGDLTLAPVGDVVLNPTNNSVLPGTGYDINLGALSNKYLTLHAAELWVETLVAQNTLATIGGRVLVGPTNILEADITAGATTWSVKYNNLAEGDIVYLEANNLVEFIYIDSAPSGVGPYTYTIVRNLDGSGANAWSAGDAVFNTQQEADGFIDLYSVAGIASGTGPTIAGQVRISTQAEEHDNQDFEDIGAEELSNPGFETAGAGGADIWANWIENAGSGTLSNETTNVNSGLDAMKADGGISNDVYVYQDVTVAAGEVYRFTFYTRGDGTNAGQYRVRDVTGAADIIAVTGTGVTGTTYTQVTVHITVPTSSVSVRFYLYGPNGASKTAYFDDASVKEVVTAGGWVPVLNTGNIAAETSLVHAGTYAAKLTGGAGEDSEIYDATTVVAGELYVLDFWTRGDGTNAGRYQVYDQTGAADIVARTSTGVTGTTYTRVRHTFRVPTGSTQVRVRLWAPSASGGIAYFDDVSLQEVLHNDWTEHWAIGNLNGLYGYSTDTYGVGLGSSLENYITIDPDNGMRFFDNSAAVIGSLTGTTWTLGAASSEQVVIDTTGVALKDSVGTDLIKLDTSGNATFGDVATSQANVHWNNTNNRLEFRGGTNGTVVNSYINSDGAFVIDTTTAFSSNKAIKFISTAGNAGSLWGYYLDTNPDQWGVEMREEDAKAYVQAINTTALGYQARLVAEDVVDLWVTGSTGTISFTGEVSNLWGDWNRTTDYTLTDATGQTVTWENENADTDSMWTSGSDINPSTAGRYLVIGSADFAFNTTGRREIIIRKNGTEVEGARLAAVNNSAVHMQCMTVIDMNGTTDDIDMQVRQTSGGNLTCTFMRIQVIRQS